MNTSRRSPAASPISNALRSHVAAITLLLLGGLMNTLATTVPPPGFPQMVARAERIFTASVSSVQSAWTVRGARRCIVTTVGFRIEHMHKGAAAQALQLEFLGGTVGDDTMTVQGVPTFRVGEHVILFSENNGRQFSPLVGIYHGKLVIERDAQSGASIVLRHDRRPIASASEVGTDGAPSLAAAGATIRQPMRADEFIEALNQQLRSGVRP